MVTGNTLIRQHTLIKKEADVVIDTDKHVELIFTWRFCSVTKNSCTKFSIHYIDTFLEDLFVISSKAHLILLFDAFNIHKDFSD